MYIIIYGVPNNISLNGSDHAEYTRKSRFTEDENVTKITKVRVDGNKLRTGKEWRP